MPEITVLNEKYSIDWFDPSKQDLKEPLHETFVAIDTETELIVDGDPIKPVIMQVCYPSLHKVHIVHYKDIPQYLKKILKVNSRLEWVFHTAPFDLEVMSIPVEGISIQEDVRDLLERGKITDVYLRYILFCLENGYPIFDSRLATISKNLLKLNLDKDESVRLTFKQSEEVSDKHLIYAAEDAIATALIRKALSSKMETEDLQTRGYVALHSIQRNGLLMDKEYVVAMRNKLSKEMDSYLTSLTTFGWFPGVEGNSSVLQYILETIEKQISLKFPRTDKTKNISMTNELVQIFEDNEVPVHPFIETYFKYKYLEHIMSAYLDATIGVDGRVHPTFKPILKTGRTSASNPPVQQMPREHNIRGIYVAPPEHVLVSIDYNQLELCALAAHCKKRYGSSKMHELINAGIDLHTWFGMEIYKKEGNDLEAEIEKIKQPDWTDKEIYKWFKSTYSKYRDMAKACNFGYPGGLGLKTFMAFARNTYNVVLDKKKALELKELWLNSFPEMTYHLSPVLDIASTKKNIRKLFTKTFCKKYKLDFFKMQNCETIDEVSFELNKAGFPQDHIWDILQQCQSYMVTILSGRTKRNCTFCACANYCFQALSADGAKEALWNIYKAGYKIVNFIHVGNSWIQNTVNCWNNLRVLYTTTELVTTTVNCLKNRGIGQSAAKLLKEKKVQRLSRQGVHSSEWKCCDSIKEYDIVRSVWKHTAA